MKPEKFHIQQRVNEDDHASARIGFCLFGWIGFSGPHIPNKFESGWRFFMSVCEIFPLAGFAVRFVFVSFFRPFRSCRGSFFNG
jgi:hypothetical protein